MHLGGQQMMRISHLLDDLRAGGRPLFNSEGLYVIKSGRVIAWKAINMTVEAADLRGSRRCCETKKFPEGLEKSGRWKVSLDNSTISWPYMLATGVVSTRISMSIYKSTDLLANAPWCYHLMLWDWDLWVLSVKHSRSCWQHENYHSKLTASFAWCTKVCLYESWAVYFYTTIAKWPCKKHQDDGDDIDVLAFILF